MKFLLRSLLVFAIAVSLGVALYYVVQALPGASPSPGSPQVQRPPENGVNPPAGKERSENNGGFHFRWRSLLDITRRIILFSVLVFASILGKRFIFDRKPEGRRNPD
ncbi:MAG: hypothetical protein QM730_00845 [Anaerolineales bacterium]